MARTAGREGKERKVVVVKEGDVMGLLIGLIASKPIALSIAL